MSEDWVDRERRTARLIQACYDAIVSEGREPSPDDLYSLCQLTWITKGRGNVTDNTRAVVAPALSHLLGLELAATSVPELARELRRLDAPAEVARFGARPVGMVNYYGGFRGVARDWLRRNRAAVVAIAKSVAANEGSAEAYRKIGSLAPLPRAGAGDGKPSNLLTPLLACLDPRGRAPIINGRKLWLLRRLGLASASLEQQHDGLVNLIGQAGIGDAFDLDVADEDQIEAAMRSTPPTRRRPRPPPGPKPLAERYDEDIAYLRTADTVQVRRLHNTMTNDLLSICKRAGLTVEEGSNATSLFDALVLDYRDDRHLLIELKTDDAMPMCRMAVGQLLDYRRHLANRAAIDLAVMFPTRPSDEARKFLAFVGVNVLWLNAERNKVAGSVQLT